MIRETLRTKERTILIGQSCAGGTTAYHASYGSVSAEDVSRPFTIIFRLQPSCGPSSQPKMPRKSSKSRSGPVSSNAREASSLPVRIPTSSHRSKYKLPPLSLNVNAQPFSAERFISAVPPIPNPVHPDVHTPKLRRIVKVNGKRLKIKQDACRKLLQFVARVYGQEKLAVPNSYSSSYPLSALSVFPAPVAITSASRVLPLATCGLRGERQLRITGENKLNTNHPTSAAVDALLKLRFPQIRNSEQLLEYKGDILTDASVNGPSKITAFRVGSVYVVNNLIRDDHLKWCGGQKSLYFSLRIRLNPLKVVWRREYNLSDCIGAEMDLTKEFLLICNVPERDLDWSLKISDHTGQREVKALAVLAAALGLVRYGAHQQAIVTNCPCVHFLNSISKRASRV